MSKRWAEFDFDTKIEVDNIVNFKNLNYTQKRSITRKPTNKSRNLKVNGYRDNSGAGINFFEELEPKNLDELAVHKKKISEVEQWLQKCFTYSNNLSAILLITGPAGCGKTITVKILCKLIGLELNEWENPVDLDFENYKKQTDQFRDFLFESKYLSLFSKKCKRVILVKDIPNTFIRDPKEFQPILEQYYFNSNGPVIFICTDVASANINLKNKLFPDEITRRFTIENISFNPTSATLLKSALKRAENLIKSHLGLFKLPEQHIVDSIVDSSSGDLRCALNQYYFASLPTATNLPVDIDVYDSQNPKRKRKNQKAVSKVKQMCKDEVLGLFHGVGRVLNPKWQENSIKPRLNCNVNLIVDEFLTYPNVALGFLQENYPKHFGLASDLCQAADILSFSQIIVEKWHQGYTDNVSEGLWIAVLGLMVLNKHKITAWNPIKGPKKIKTRNQDDSIINNVLKMDSSYIRLLSNGNKTSVYSCLNKK